MPGRVDRTNTLFFIDEEKIPRDRRKDFTYESVVCKKRTRLTVGSDKINYHGDVSAPTSCLLTVKLLVNSVISTEEAELMTIDIKNFYLNTPLA